jgi:hypothetical protein
MRSPMSRERAAQRRIPLVKAESVESADDQASWYTGYSLGADSPRGTMERDWRSRRACNSASVGGSIATV